GDAAAAPARRRCGRELPGLDRGPPRAARRRGPDRRRRDRERPRPLDHGVRDGGARESLARRPVGSEPHRAGRGRVGVLAAGAAAGCGGAAGDRARGGRARARRLRGPAPRGTRGRPGTPGGEPARRPLRAARAARGGGRARHAPARDARGPPGPVIRLLGTGGRALYTRALVGALAITIAIHVAAYMLNAVLPFRATALGATGTQVGLMFSVTAGVAMFFRPVVGGWADRHGVRVVLVPGVIVRALTSSRPHAPAPPPSGAGPGPLLSRHLAPGRGGRPRRHRAPAAGRHRVELLPR